MISHWRLTERSGPNKGSNAPGHPRPASGVDPLPRAAIAKSTDDFAGLYAVDGIHEFPFTRPGVHSRLQAGTAAWEGFGR